MKPTWKSVMSQKQVFHWYHTVIWSLQILLTPSLCLLLLEQTQRILPKKITETNVSVLLLMTVIFICPWNKSSLYAASINYISASHHCSLADGSQNGIWQCCNIAFIISLQLWLTAGHHSWHLWYVYFHIFIARISIRKRQDGSLRKQYKKSNI